jgi:hypothetical protein
MNHEAMVTQLYAALNPLDVADWLNAIVENRYVYDDGAWIVVGQALPSRI